MPTDIPFAVTVTGQASPVPSKSGERTSRRGKPTSSVRNGKASVSVRSVAVSDFFIVRHLSAVGSNGSAVAPSAPNSSAVPFGTPTCHVPPCWPAITDHISFVVSRRFHPFTDAIAPRNVLCAFPSVALMDPADSEPSLMKLPRAADVTAAGRLSESPKCTCCKVGELNAPFAVFHVGSWQNQTSTLHFAGSVGLGYC